MEIPIEETIAGLEKIIPKDIASNQVTEETVKLKLDTIQLIKAQALEIRELQTTICRLKVEIQQNYDDYRISSDLREAGIRTGE